MFFKSLFERFKRKHAFGAMVLLAVVYGLSSYATAQYPGFSDPGSRQAGNGGGAGLVPVAPNVDGGEIPTGATAQVVVRFRNEGSQPVQTGLIRLYPSSTVSAQVALNQCQEEPLESGAECAIALSVKGLQAGSWRVEMLMSHSGRTRLVTSTLSGSVETSGDASQNLASDIEAIPETLDFGTLNSNQTLIEPVTFRNITSNPIDIQDVYIDAGGQSGYELKTECKTLQPGQACIGVVTWSPKLSGRSSGVIVVDHSGPTALTSVPLSGEYAPDNVDEAQVFPQAVPGRGLLVSSQTEINFGSAVATASTITISLVNTGDVDLNIRDIRLSGSDAGLSFTDEGCAAGTVLQPVEACPLTLSWSPTRIGPVLDDVQITHDGARGVLVLPIRGDASAAVSQNQRAIVLSDSDSPAPVVVDSTVDAADLERVIENPAPAPSSSSGGFTQGIVNPSSVLDGFRITSFSPSRAIINGPGGSQLVHDGQEALIGGIPWFVVIQSSGIEFLHNGQRVLLLFDRSLSSVNRVGASSGGGVAGSVAATGDDI